MSTRHSWPGAIFPRSNMDRHPSTAHLSDKPNRNKVWQIQNWCQPDTPGQGPSAHGREDKVLRSTGHALGPSRNVLGSNKGQEQIFWGQQVMLWGPTATPWGQTRERNKCFGVNRSCSGVKQKRSGVEENKVRRIAPWKQSQIATFATLATPPPGQALCC